MNWRAISDTAPLSESLASVSLGAEVLFWRMLAVSDPWGCLPGSTRKVHHECLGLRATDHTIDEVRVWLEELKKAGRIKRHRNGITYIELVDFDKWQPDGWLKRRGPSAFLHPDGMPTLETRPHDPRRSQGRDKLGRFSAQPSHATRKRIHGSAEAEAEAEAEEKETDSRASSRSTARTGEPTADRKRSGTPDPTDAVAVLADALEHADANTEKVLRKLGLPEAAYRSALEALTELRQKGKAPTNDAGWAVARLNKQIIDRTYRRKGNG